MSLAAALTTPARPKRPTCTLGEVLINLTNDERDALKAALSNPEFTNKQIASAITDNTDTYMGESTVRRHRNGGCKCEPR